jgi:hypothetical protein
MTTINWLMPFRENINFALRILQNMKVKNAALLAVKSGGTYRHRCALSIKNTIWSSVLHNAKSAEEASGCGAMNWKWSPWHDVTKGGYYPSIRLKWLRKPSKADTWSKPDGPSRRAHAMQLSTRILQVSPMGVEVTTYPHYKNHLSARQQSRVQLRQSREFVCISQNRQTDRVVFVGQPCPASECARLGAKENIRESPQSNTLD